MTRRLATGSQGSWMAHTAYGYLPCLKAECLGPRGRYNEVTSHYDHSRPRDAEYLDAIARGLVVLARYKPGRSGTPMRDGYTGIFRVENIDFNTGVACQFVERLA